MGIRTYLYSESDVFKPHELILGILTPNGVIFTQ